MRSARNSNLESANPESPSSEPRRTVLENFKLLKAVSKFDNQTVGEKFT